MSQTLLSIPGVVGNDVVGRIRRLYGSGRNHPR